MDQCKKIKKIKNKKMNQIKKIKHQATPTTNVSAINLVPYGNYFKY